MKLTTENYNETVKNTKGLLVVDFWASWCGPCRMMAPIIDELEAEMPDVTFAKVNIDEEVQPALENNITSIPTLLFVKDGEVINKSVGVVSKDQLISMINEAK